jgi:hypothetical protein
VKPWLKKGCLACSGAVVLGLLVLLVIAGIFFVQHSREQPREQRLTQEIPGGFEQAEAGTPGKVVLSLSSAAVFVEAGPPGEPIRVVSDFDPRVHRMTQTFEEDDVRGWRYRLDFHEKRLLHVSVVRVWLGKRSPEVRVFLPPDLPHALQVKMAGGYLTLDLADLTLTTVDVELDRGVLDLDVSEPLTIPLERMQVGGRIGAMRLSSLGNASPAKLRVRHGVGASQVDLTGVWRIDSDIEYRVAFGGGELYLPRGIRIEGLDRGVRPLARDESEELSTPTLRISTHFDVGDIRVTD